MGHEVSTFAGRGVELAVLEAALAGRESRAVAVAVTGEPGIGKSRLLSDALSRVTDRRTVIAAGRASEFERQLPFSVLVDALDAYLGSVAGRRLATLSDLEGPILAHMFPSLAELQAGASRPIDPSQLNRALRSLLAILAADGRLVLVLDDVHWADQASLEAVVHLLHRPVPRTTVVVAFRPARAPGVLRHAVNAACDRGDCTEIGLGPLSPDDAEQLLGGVAGAERRGAIYREAGGNPFYLEHLARAAATGHSTPGAELSGVPTGVARALAAELGELPAKVRIVIDAASVAGEPFAYDLVSAVSGLESDAVRDALDEAVARGLAAPTPVPGRFVFRHPIVRRAVYASAPPAWLLGAHERAAAALRVAGAPPASLAHHVELSGRTGTQAVELFVAAGRESARVAPATAVRWYLAAARALPDDAGPEQRLALLVPLAAALTAAGQLEPACETLSEILDLLPLEPPVLRARPLVAMAVIERVLGRAGEARRTLARTVEQAAGEQSAVAAALQLELAADRHIGGDWTAMGVHARAALTQAREYGDASLVAAAGAVLGLAELNTGEVGSARRRVAESAALVDEMPDSEARLHLGAIHWLGWCEHHLELYDDVLRHYGRGLALGARTGQRHLLVPMLLGFAITQTWKGDLASAAESAQDAIDSAELVGAQPLIQLTFALRCWLRCEPVACLRRSPRASSSAGAPTKTAGRMQLLARIWLGEALIDNGDPATGSHDDPDGRRRTASAGDRAIAAPIFLELLSRAELAIGDRTDAERWAAMAADAAAVFDLRGPAAFALRARAELALAAGDAHGAAVAALEAVAVVGDSHPLERERSRFLAGRALATTGDPAAIEPLDEAYSRFGEFGALPAAGTRGTRAARPRQARPRPAAAPAALNAGGAGELAAPHRP